MLSERRPSLTWFDSHQETGATFVYQGQTVLFVWQSRQDRSRIAATSGVICVRALIVCDSSTAGFVRAGRIAWMPTTKTTSKIATIFSTLRIQQVYSVAGGSI